MKKSFKITPIALLIAAAIMLIASTVGSTQAALNYYSETYSAKVTISSIGVSLVENGTVVSHRDYLQNDEWDMATGKLLTNMLPAGEELVLGKTYQEKLSVTNSGDIDSYVRVVLRKSWLDADGVKDTTLSPDLIGLNLITGTNGWVVDEKASTAERTVLYYTNILPAGASTAEFTDTLKIDSSIGSKVIETVKTDANGFKIITYVYEYDGYTFNVEAEVDAVQTHNAQDAIKSAWGVSVNVSEDGSLSLQ